MSYENPWTFENEIFDTDQIGDFFGFVYIITNTSTGAKYVGRKYFWSTRKLNKAAKRRTTVESDWKKYYGSSKVLLEQIQQQGKKNFRREIVSLHSTKGDVNYAEVFELFNRNVLENEDYINDNIAGKWFRKPEHISGKRKLSSRSSWRTLK
jgi:hypothetical protein